MRRAVRKDLAARRHDEAGGVRIRARLGLHHRARFDGQRRAVEHIHKTSEHIFVRAIPGRVRGNVARHIHEIRAASCGDPLLRDERPSRDPEVIRIESALVGDGAVEAVIGSGAQAGQSRAALGRTRVQTAVGRAADATQHRVHHFVAPARVVEQQARAAARHVHRHAVGREVPEQVVPDVQRPIRQEAARARIRDAHRVAAELRQDAVIQARRRILADRQAVVRARVRARADPRRVVDFELRQRCVARRDAVGLAVPLAAVVFLARLLNREPELVLATISLVGVEAVVVVERAHQILRVHRAAEELKPVIRHRIALHVLDRRPAAHRAHRQSVELLVRQEHHARVPDRHIAHHAGGIVVVVAAETVHELAVDLRCRGQSLEHVILRARPGAGDVARRVQHGLAQQHHSAPQPALEDREIVRVGHVVRFRRENNRPRARPVREDFAARRHDEAGGVRIGAGLALHHRARFDGQRRAVEHIHKTVQHIFVRAVPGCVRRNGARYLHGVRHRALCAEQTRGKAQGLQGVFNRFVHRC